MILLRTLTERSLVPFGKQKGNRVCDLLRYYPEEIAKLYYTVEWLSFTEEVLAEIGITEEWSIPKPGVFQGLYRTFLREGLTKQGAKRTWDPEYNKRKEQKKRKNKKKNRKDINLKALPF